MALIKKQTKKLQRIVAYYITQTFGLPFRSAAARSANVHGIDIELQEDALKVFPFSIICNNAVHHKVITKLQQAKDYGYPDTLAAVVWRPQELQYDQTLITFDLQQFLTFWRDYANKNTVS